MRTSRLAHAISLALSLFVATTAVAARAQGTRGSVDVVDAMSFDLDDALLQGITLTDAQRQDVLELRRLQLAERDASQEQLWALVAIARRAHERGDDATTRAVMASLQSTATSERTWRLAAVRALLTPEQRVRFDHNIAALVADAQGADPASR